MEPTLDNNITMDEMMRKWPTTIRVVLRYRMLCVGCPIASFNTISDAAKEHDIDEKLLRRDLEAAIAAENSAQPTPFPHTPQPP